MGTCEINHARNFHANYSE